MLKQLLASAVKPLLEGAAKLAALLFMRKTGKDAVRLDLAENQLAREKRNREIDSAIDRSSDLVVLDELREKHRRPSPTDRE